MSDFQPIHHEVELDEVLTRPGDALIRWMPTLSSPLVILGSGGKMGPSLAVLAQRAATAAHTPIDILAVSRFSDTRTRQWLEDHGVRTLSLDLMDRAAYSQLPDAANVLYLVGLKFGTTHAPSLTWATHTLIPAYTCERYPQAKIVALSTGNVYPLTPVDGAGSQEEEPLTPLGEYANSCVGRERIFTYYTGKNGTQVALIRLSYAVDLRYGVLHDIARRVFSDQIVDLSTGYFQCIWQADANEMILRSFDLAATPAFPINLTSPTRLSVRETAQTFARWIGKEPHFEGTESATAYLSQTQRMCEALGQPPTPMDWVLRWAADWVTAGGRSFEKPTHFDTRDGKY